VSVRLLVCDDEALAAERLLRLLARRPDVEIVGTARHGEEALAAAAETRPDAILLDIEMPGLDGFDVVEALPSRIDPDKAPFIVFVTAYPQFAAHAYDSGAIDFLTKPVRFTRLSLALDRLARELDARTAAGRLRELSRQLETLRAERLNGSTEQERIWVTSGGEMLGIAVRSLDRISAESEYVRLYRGSDQFLYRCSISALMPRLDAQRFVRIHRSHVLNVGQISAVRRRATGGYRVVTVNGEVLPVGRTYRSVIRRLVGSMPEEEGSG
jgi:DNA-binding LytR/AlgR family response regulator